MEVALPPPAFAPKSASKCNDPAELEQGDFLAIDDLLDFSNEDIGGPIEPCVSSATSCELKLDASLPFDRKLSSQPCGFDSDSLCVPCDDLAELEWLSNFVEESFSSSDAPACLGASFGAHSGLTDDDKAAQRRSKNEESFHTTSPVSVLETNAFAREKHCPPFSFSPDMPSVPGRARSKRCRTAVCFWNTRILCPEVSESLLERASTTYTIRAGSSDSNMYNSYYDYDDEEDHAQEEDDDDAGPLVLSQPNQRAKNPSVKFKNSCYVKAKDSIKHFSPKPKKMKVDDGTPIRKCLHCATQKTPQWRAGPMGPKTLCNACGVRFKSGRLCEEYRPAASPTFIEAVHSNSHRKVLEMRRQRGDMVIGHDSQRHKDNSHRLKWSTGGELSSATGAATVEDDEQQASVVSKDNEAARIEE